LHSSVHRTFYAEEYPAFPQVRAQYIKQPLYTIYFTVCCWASEARNVQKLSGFVILLFTAMQLCAVVGLNCCNWIV